MKEAKVLYGTTGFGDPMFSADMLWRVGFNAPDPCALFEIEGKTILMISPLEADRALKESRASEVVLEKDYDEESTPNAILAFLKSRKVKHVTVPDTFPYTFAKILIDGGTKLKTKKPLFYSERIRKTEVEIKEITASQYAAELALANIMDFLADCDIQAGFIWKSTNTASEAVKVTSEMLQERIRNYLFLLGYFAPKVIVASGTQGADPHCFGFGPIVPYSPIVIDIWPVSFNSHYYGDLTRTIFKGEPRLLLKRMYNKVLGAQGLAMDMLHAGADTYDIWKSAIDFFAKNGYPTDKKSTPKKGFFHSVGHGLGLEIHEPPRIGDIHILLEEDSVVTIEPGLYYQTEEPGVPAGAVRIEDVVIIGKNNCRNITTAPKDLEEIIIP